MRKKQSPKRNKKWGFVKTFLAGFMLCGAGIDLLNLVVEGLTDWALEQLLVKAVGSIVASILTIIARPIIRAIIVKNGGKAMKFFKKIGNFFKRVGAYLKANKRTLGGIITSILTGGAGTTVCVFGYTYDLTDLIASLPCFEWVRQLAINGFDLTPIICGVIIWLIAIWNAVAAVSRGWESPEEYKAANDAEKADKENDTSDETDSTTTVSSEKTENQKVVVSSTVNVDSKVDTAVNALDALIASQNIDNK